MRLQKHTVLKVHSYSHQLMNNEIKKLVKNLFSEKPLYSTIILDETLEQGLEDTLTLLTEARCDIEVRYFSSQAGKVCDVEDRLVVADGKLQVYHQPIGGEGEFLSEDYSATSHEYVNKLKFRDSITFLVVDYTLFETNLRRGVISFNRFQKVESPMTKEEIFQGSYITHATARNKLMIASDPHKNNS